MQISLAVSLTSIPVLGGGLAPEPNAPDIASLTLVGSGEVGSPISYSRSYTTSPYPSPTPTHQWLADGEEVEGETGATYTPTEADEGKTISLSLFVQNSEGFDAAVSSNSITVVFPAPILTDVAVSPSSGNTGDTFTGSYTLVALGVTVLEQWLRDGVEISGATGPTYQATPEDGTATLTYRVRATNSGGSVEALSDPAASVTYAEAPALTGWAITPSSGVEAGDSLVVQGTVTGVPTPDLTFQWTLDGVNISGETAATLGSAPEGAVRCVITATNSEDVATVTVGPVTVAAITPGAPTLSGIPDQSLDVDDGVQSLDLSTYATGDALGYYEIQTDNLVAIAALVVQEGVGGERECSGAFPFAAPEVAFSYAITGAAATFAVGSDPRGGITDANVPAGVSMVGSKATVSGAAADLVATDFTVWKYTASVVASQTLSITVTDTPADVWDITPGAETITVAAYPSVSTPTADGGVETIERTA